MLNIGNNPFLTLFTPTYNRKEELVRLYESLKNLTSKNIEWLIVDDGSEDDTKEFIESISTYNNNFKILYFYQENKGKPSAYNFALEKANGYFFAVIDSDDTLLPNSVEILESIFINFDLHLKSTITSIVGLCISPSGQLIGKKFNENFQISSWTKISAKKNFGEKWGIHKIELLRNYKYPIFKGEKFIPESFIWDKIGQTNNIICINKELRVYYENSQGSLTGEISKLRLKNPNSFKLYYKQKFFLSKSIFLKLSYILKYSYMIFIVKFNELFSR